MAIITKPNTFTSGYVANAAEVNADFDTIFNDYNGNITDANLAASGIQTYGKVSGSALATLGNINAGAGTIPAVNLPDSIADSHLATISTAGKVNGAAITALTSVPAGAGVLPIANTQNIDALLPAQGSASGKFLTSDGANASWGVVTVPSTFYISTSAGTLLYSADTERTYSPPLRGDYVPVKAYAAGFRGSLFVSYDAKAVSDDQCYARLAKNGVIIGSANLLTGSYQTYSAAVTGLCPSDRIEIGANVNSGSGGDLIYIRNFRVYYNYSFTDGTLDASI